MYRDGVHDNNRTTMESEKAAEHHLTDEKQNRKKTKTQQTVLRKRKGIMYRTSTTEPLQLTTYPYRLPSTPTGYHIAPTAHYRLPSTPTGHHLSSKHYHLQATIFLLHASIYPYRPPPTSYHLPHHSSSKCYYLQATIHLLQASIYPYRPPPNIYRSVIEVHNSGSGLLMDLECHHGFACWQAFLTELQADRAWQHLVAIEEVHDLVHGDSERHVLKLYNGRARSTTLTVGIVGSSWGWLVTESFGSWSEHLLTTSSSSSWTALVVVSPSPSWLSSSVSFSVCIVKGHQPSQPILAERSTSCCSGSKARWLQDWSPRETGN
ncbi:hypothetical protein EYF80_049212 [Liparis tanakae]|uniref:Uncharacterized protein n=1 Tax=Liparis tanakae TaxID=230148 RepID=A0A4Z2FK15_9TELE|nr:hypothetical protein EYF80_049212 [Liparis tanakae]